MGVRPALPFEGVTMILGNGLGGARVCVGWSSLCEFSVSISQVVGMRRYHQHTADIPIVSTKV